MSDQVFEWLWENKGCFIFKTVNNLMANKSLLRRSANRLLHVLARIAPGAMSFRPYIHRLRGVRIFGDVFIGDDVYLENEYPDCVEIHDGVTIALRSTIIAHFRGSGRIIIGRNVWISSCCTVAAKRGQVLRIGEGSLLAANSVVTKDVPAFTFLAGVPAKPIARITVPMTFNTSLKDFKAGLRPLDAE